MIMLNLEIEIARKTHNTNVVTLTMTVQTGREETHSVFHVRHIQQGELVNAHQFTHIRHALNKFDAIEI